MFTSRCSVPGEDFEGGLVCRGLARYFTFYNGGRPHSALAGRTPDMVYYGVQPEQRAA